MVRSTASRPRSFAPPDIGETIVAAAKRLPPAIFGTARLLEYAIVDNSVVFTGRQSLFVDGKLLGAVPFLALCRDLVSEEINLFHCNLRWKVIGVSGGSTIVGTKELAERAYCGISTKWTTSPYTEDQVVQQLEKTWGRHRCSFCQKWPWDVQQIFEGPRSSICDECIGSFAKILE